MAQDISLLGATYPDVPAVTLPKSGGGTALFIEQTELANAGTQTPSADSGNGSAGTSTSYAREDHVHPKDTSIPTKTSDLTNDSGFIDGLVILSYGSSTWQNFLDAYTAQKVVYCRASSDSNPATGSQTRLAFMAYVNNASANSITSVEFQYYRSVSSHSATQQGDQVFVYTLSKTGGWSVTKREASTKIAAGSNMSQSYSNGTLTLSYDSTATQGTATAASPLPSGITSVDVKYVKCVQVVTVYLVIGRDSTSITSYTTVASGLPIPAAVPTTSGGSNYPLAAITVAGTQGQRPLQVYVNSSGSLRVNYGNAEGNYLGAFTYITSDV